MASVAATAEHEDLCATDSLHKSWMRTQCLQSNELLLARRVGDPAALRAVLSNALASYESYYRARAKSAGTDPILTLAEPSSSPLERAAHWLAGWRPTTFIQLHYSESALLFESQLDQLLQGVPSGDLSRDQLVAVDALHRRTVLGERELSRELADIQDAMVQSFPPSDSDMQMQTEQLGEVLARAEELRMLTLRELTAELDTAQAVDLLIALAELEHGLRSVNA